MFLRSTIYCHLFILFFQLWHQNWNGGGVEWKTPRRWIISTWVSGLDPSLIFLLHLVRFDEDIPYFSIVLYHCTKEVFERRCFLSFIVGSRGRLRLPQLLITFVALGNAEFVSYLPLFFSLLLGSMGFLIFAGSLKENLGKFYLSAPVKAEMVSYLPFIFSFLT